MSLLLTLSFFPSRLLSIAPVLPPARLSPLRTAPHIIRESAKARLIFSVSECTVMPNRRGLKSDPRWRQANFRGKGFACSCSTPHYSFALMVGSTCPSPVWCTSMEPHCFSCTNTDLPSGLCRMLFPDQWTHSVSLAFLLCLFIVSV